MTVEGLNCHYRYMGAEEVSDKGEYPGMLMANEAPLLVTGQVMLVDPSDNKPTEVTLLF